MAEFLVRFVFDVVLYGLLEFAGSIGRFIARTVVPLFAGKRMLIECPATSSSCGAGMACTA